MDDSARELYEALRSLERRACATRAKARLPGSRRAAASACKELPDGAEVSGQRINDWVPLKDSITPTVPRDWRPVWALVRVWSSWADMRSTAADQRYWSALVEAAQRKGSRLTSEGGVRLGRLIADLDDPFALEVHRAIHVSTAAKALPLLPLYVERAHDDRLREVVERAAGGANVMAMLVGGSSTGKTRACWEAIHQLPAGWRLWHPISPLHTDALLKDLPEIGPHTVLWLNDAQHYLFTPGRDAGERVAAGLRELLHGSDRRAVLVLATIWPEYWHAITASPPLRGDDPHSQARPLLEDIGIPVPSAFDAEEMDALRAKASDDVRLEQAVANAEEGQIAQYLAAAPELLRRYRMGPRGAQALIEAAMDARRLGHSLPLQPKFLEAAGIGYMTEIEWDLLGEDWLEQALAYTARPCHGARGPLSRVRPRPGHHQASEGPRYRLADYLEQFGRADRRTTIVPTAFWDAVVDHVQNTSYQDIARLADSAERRMLYHHAELLYRHLIAAADRDEIGDRAVDSLVRLLTLQGRPEVVIQFFRERADTGDPTASKELIDLLAHLGRVADLWPFAHSGDSRASQRLIELFTDSERSALSHKLDPRRRWVGDFDSKRNRQRADTDQERTEERLIDILVRRGHVEELREWAAAGNETAAERLIDLLAEQGCEEELRSRASDGDRRASDGLIDLLIKQDRTTAAIELLETRANADDAGAGDQLIDLLAENGQETALRAQATAGSPRAVARFVAVLEAQGRSVEALGLVQARTAAGDNSTALLLADLLVRTGATHEALKLLRERWAAGDGRAADRLVDLLSGEEDLDEALQLARARGSEVERSAGTRLAYALVRQQRLDVAFEVLRALEAGGDLDATTRLYDVAVCYDRADVLRVCADAGDRLASKRLVDCHFQHGRTEEAISVLQEQAADDEDAARQLVRRHMDQGCAEDALDVLRRWAHPRRSMLAMDFCALLSELDREQELRERADDGDVYARVSLAGLWIRQGRIEAVLMRAEEGDKLASDRLAFQLAEEHRADSAMEFLTSRAGAFDGAGAGKLIDCLVEAGRGDEGIAALMARARSGEEAAFKWCVALVTDHVMNRDSKRIADAWELLRISVSTGLNPVRAALPVSADPLRPGRPRVSWYTDDLVDILDPRDSFAGEPERPHHPQDAIEILSSLADAGGYSVQRMLDDILAKEGRAEQLLARVEAGDWHALDPFVTLLIKQGRSDEVISYLRTWVGQANFQAEWRLVQVLAQQEREEDLRREVTAGTRGAGDLLVSLLQANEDTKETAETIRRYGLNPDGSVRGGERSSLTDRASGKPLS